MYSNQAGGKNNARKLLKIKFFFSFGVSIANEQRRLSTFILSVSISLANPFADAVSLMTLILISSLVIQLFSIIPDNLKWYFFSWIRFACQTHADLSLYYGNYSSQFIAANWTAWRPSFIHSLFFHSFLLLKSFVGSARCAEHMAQSNWKSMWKLRWI